MWIEIEKDMFAWAQKKNVSRRTHRSCRRRYMHLEPEKYDQHARVRAEGATFTINSQPAILSYHDLFG